MQPDFIGEGRLAAEILERMMAGRDLPPGKRIQKVGIREIVHRESTVAQSVAGRFVQKVLAYINKNALKKIGVSDVAKRFKVSRSLLELRFRELQGESVYEAILRIRMEEVKHRLRHTNMPIAEIIAACGWQNAISPKALFRKRFGMSMSQYRAANTIASSRPKNTLSSKNAANRTAAKPSPIRHITKTRFASPTNVQGTPCNPIT